METSSANEAMEQEDQIKLLRRYVMKLLAGGNVVIKCNLCEISFIGSYTRVRAHLLKFSGEGVRPCSKTQDGVPPKVSSPLEKGFNLQGRVGLNAIIARMSPYYREAFSYAANTPNHNGYKPPGYNKLRTTLLTTERSHVENLMQPIRNSWNQKGVTIVRNGRSLINFMVVTKSGPMFLMVVNCYGDVKDKDFIAQHTKDAIMEVGLSMYNNFNSLKLLSVAPTRLAPTIVMLKRFRSLKKGLQKWLLVLNGPTYRDDDVGKEKKAKENLLDDISWNRKTNTDMASLNLVRQVIYRHERKIENEESPFYDVVHKILMDHSTKSSTPLHCLAHSLNQDIIVMNDPLRVPLHQDVELTDERKKCFRIYFDDMDVRRQFANFSGGREGFHDADSLRDRGELDSKSWWLVHGAHEPTLQKIVLKLLGQPSSSSCYERNWRTYNLIYSLKINKMSPKREEDLVYVLMHSKTSKLGSDHSG
ncbi:hypothetical protein HKD37_05G012820 [Glycine soja]